MVPTAAAAEQQAIEAFARLRNLGPVSARLMVEAGITSPQQLRAMGAVEAFRRVLFHRGGAVSTNLLWALHGALIDVRWDRLPGNTRKQLRDALDAGSAPVPKRRRSL
jgi:DNA transformation protein and related proteins